MRLINLDNINLRQTDEGIVFDIIHAEPVEAIPVSVLKEWQKQYSNKVTFGHIMKLVDEWRKKE